MINLELFSCAGGMAEGFRRAGIHFDLAVDFTEDHCDSYEANLGYRPIRMDVNDLCRMVSAGWHVDVDLLVADPPCTPWSRAGKRLGVLDERDMLVTTCEIIAALKPRRYLIGNVPGLDDQPNWHIVQKVIGGLEKHGYCVADFAALDAANYSVPQHRIRPFWFGHQFGDCLRWPAPTHGDPEILMRALPMPGIVPLIPWVTCKQALGHLSPEELGRPVKLRRQRKQNSKQHGSVNERPARVVGTSALSDGNVLLENPHARRGEITWFGDHHQQSSLEAPARAITRNTHGDGTVLVLNDRHPVATPDEPAPTMGAKIRGQGAQVLMTEQHHPPSYADEPAKTVRAGSGGGPNRALVLDGSAPTRRKRGGSTQGEQWSRVHGTDAPSPTVLTDTDRTTGNAVKMEICGSSPPGRPDLFCGLLAGHDSAHQCVDTVTASSKHPALTLDAPATTVRGGGDGHAAPHLVLEVSTCSKHPPSYADEPANTIRGTSGGGNVRTMSLRPRQGERVADADAPAPTVTRAVNHNIVETVAPMKRRRKKDIPQSGRVAEAGEPAPTVQSREDRQGKGLTLEWPWERPGTAVQADERLAPPGHHDENFATRSLPGAVILSERAAAILQGFSESWVFKGETKSARWSQIGQAMPPPLAHAVATSVAAQELTVREAPCQNCGPTHGCRLHARPTGIVDAVTG